MSLHNVTKPFAKTGPFNSVSPQNLAFPYISTELQNVALLLPIKLLIYTLLNKLKTP